MIYVNADATGPADGFTWSTAFTNMQAAAQMEGAGEAMRVQAFFDGLDSGLSPADVDPSIETR